jgi:hypothetical protein
MVSFSPILKCEKVTIRALWSSKIFLIAPLSLFIFKLGLYFAKNKQRQTPKG